MTQEYLNQMVERIKEIVFHPKQTWEKIREENQSTKDIFNFLCTLAIVPAGASFLGMWLIGYWVSVKPIFRLSLGRSLFYALLGYVFAIGSVWLIGKIIVYLAPRFGFETDETKAMKVAVYSCVPYLAAGILNLFPALSAFQFIAGIYTVYLFYIGLPILVEVPKEKQFSFIVSILICMVCLYLITGWLSSLILGPVLVT